MYNIDDLFKSLLKENYTQQCYRYWIKNKVTLLNNLSAQSSANYFAIAKKIEKDNPMPFQSLTAVGL